jgi:hypothetical protein
LADRLSRAAIENVSVVDRLREQIGEATPPMKSAIRDRSDDLPVYSPICFRCRHLDLNQIGARRCRALPAGIPLTIWTGQHDHLTPFPGDGGIHLEPPTEEGMVALRAEIARAEEERARSLVEHRAGRRGAA